MPMEPAAVHCDIAGQWTSAFAVRTAPKSIGKSEWEELPSLTQSAGDVSSGKGSEHQDCCESTGLNKYGCGAPVISGKRGTGGAVIP